MTPRSQELSAIVDGLVEAYNAGDARRFADHFTEDGSHGEYRGTGGQTGREAI